MLHVEFFTNNRNNHWLIRQFEVFNFSNSDLIEKFIPRPDISLIFHFKDCPEVIGNTHYRIGPFFLATIIPKSITLRFHGIMDSFVVVCKPTVFTRVFQLNLSDIHYHMTDLPHDRFHPLWVELSRLSSVYERMECFTRFINSVVKGGYCPDEIDLLYDKVVEQCTTVPLKEILSDRPFSVRTLERNFIKRTGVSLKMLTRIVRIDYLWTKINQENAIDYQDLVFDGNYFDQSHFIHDFQSIIGESPGYFFHRNMKMARLFSGRIEGQE